MPCSFSSLPLNLADKELRNTSNSSLLRKQLIRMKKEKKKVLVCHNTISSLHRQGVTKCFLHPDEAVMPDKKARFRTARWDSRCAGSEVLPQRELAWHKEQALTFLSCMGYAAGQKLGAAVAVAQTQPGRWDASSKCHRATAHSVSLHVLADPGPVIKPAATVWKALQRAVWSQIFEFPRERGLPVSSH